MNKDNIKLTFVKSAFTAKQELQYASGGIKAGFPSPAQDYMDEAIDFNRDFIFHPECTFYARCSGDSMIEAGINDGDLLVIDKLIEPKDGSIVVAFIEGEFTLKTLKIVKKGKQRRVFLMPANPDFEPIEVDEYNDFRIWGVLLYCIKDFSKK